MAIAVTKACVGSFVLYEDEESQVANICTYSELGIRRGTHFSYGKTYSIKARGAPTTKNPKGRMENRTINVLLLHGNLFFN